MATCAFPLFSPKNRHKRLRVPRVVAHMRKMMHIVYRNLKNVICKGKWKNDNKRAPTIREKITKNRGFAMAFTKKY